MIGKIFRCIFFVVFLTSMSFAMPVNAGSETIYILLTSNGGVVGATASPLEKYSNTALKNYIQNNILKGSAAQICTASVDLSKYTPAEYAQKFLSRDSKTSIFDKAMDEWFKNIPSTSAVGKWKNKQSQNKKTLADLKANRPDLLPSKFTVIADGTAGLAIREYIQSENYRGEISNVIFFNTPHEGTGFADQSMFNGTDKLKRESDADKYAAIIPLALVAYLAGGVDGLQDLMISLVKNAVMGMAYDASAITDALNNSKIFDEYDGLSTSKFYLSQDASENDAKYSSVITDDVKSALGGTQLLNSFAMKTNYEAPSYNIVYSYGMPSIGNGRRTLDDFAEQSKSHVSIEKMKTILADSLRFKLSGMAEDQLNNLSSDLIEKLYSSDAVDFVNSILGKYSSTMSELENSDVVAYVNGINRLRSFKMNKDDIPGSVMELVSIVEKFIPNEYKSELYGLFIKYFSPETRAVLATYGSCALDGGKLKDCAKEGLALAASNLANYSLNFFDEGTFDVPVYSALGENVAAFKGTAVQRYGVAMNSFIEEYNEAKRKYTGLTSEAEDQLNSLYAYHSLLSDIGKIEADRQIVDLALKGGCLALDFVGAGEACRVAEFATNVTLVALTTSKVKELVENGGALKATKDIALLSSVKDVSEKNIKMPHPDQLAEVKFEQNGMDDMLFSNPKVSIASVHTDTSVIPLLLLEPCADGDVYDFSTFKQLCRDSAGTHTSNALEIKNENFNVTGPSQSSSQPMSIKHVVYDSDGMADVKYGVMDYFSVKSFVKEFRLQIDDLQPDSIRWIKFDFNTRAQISYERVSADIWYVYFEESYQKAEPVDTLRVSPVSSEGLFVFNPQKVLDKADGSHGLAELMEDGTNVVYVSLMNKVGLTSSFNFSIFFQATEFNYNAEWPLNFAHVSKLGKISAFVNNLAYGQFKLTNVGVKVSRIEADTTISDSCAVGYALNKTRRDVKYTDSTGKDTVQDVSNTWYAAVDLDTALKILKTDVEGDYLLEWTFEILDTLGKSSQPQLLKLKTRAYVDSSAPVLSLYLPNRNLTGKFSDGAWADIVTVDSVYEPVRAMRGVLLDHVGNPIQVFNTVRHNSKHFEVDWGTLAGKISQGRYTFMVQVYDFADPGLEAYNRLVNISASDMDSWNYVANSTGFKPGFNGLTILDSIWVDNIAPEVVDGSVRISTRADSTRSGCLDSAKYSRPGEYVVNSCNLLSLSFQIREDKLGRDTSYVKTQIVFVDSADKNNVFKINYVGGIAMDSSTKTFRFDEPSANKAKDGVYSVYVEMNDEAGNISRKKIVDKVVVDRAAPSVYWVGSGGVAFDSVADLNDHKATIYVNQQNDDPRNISTLSCYRYLNAAGDTSGWNFAGSLVFGDDGKERKLQFSIADLAAGKKDGSWVVYAKCYDAAGNFDSEQDFFGMGANYPRITFPNDSVNSLYYGKVIVKGVVPNPDLHGNGNTVSFKLEWKEDGGSVWNDSGFEYLSSGIVNDDELAIWNLDSVPDGLDSLRLAVRSCDTCAYVYSYVEVPVYHVPDVLRDSVETDIDISVPTSQVAGIPDTVTISLKHATDTVAWKVESQIWMNISGDSGFTEKTTATFDPAVVSPFDDEPSTKSKDGLYVWQEGKTWHVYWKGKSSGVAIDSLNPMKRLSPKMSLRYQKGFLVAVNDSVLNSGTVDESAMKPVKIGEMYIPGFDRNVTWNLDSLVGDSLHLQFQTDSAFTLDISSVESGDSLIYCGKNARPAYEAISTFGGVGVVYVHPEHYKMHHVWAGMSDGGKFAGDSAYVKVVAYCKYDPSRIIVKEARWKLNHDAIRLVTNVDVGTPGEYPFNLSFGDSIPLRRSEIAFTYGLLGRSAYVKEEIVGPDGNVVKTYRNKSLVYAGNSRNVNRVAWSGDNSDGHVATEFGTYKFRVTAYADAADETPADELEYSFVMKSEDNFREADSTILADGQFAVDLTLDEAHLDEYGDLRYVGNRDYLLRVKAKANVLKNSYTNFFYKWEAEHEDGSPSIQFPAVYTKNRFSVGIHRHRSKFPVTVAVLLATRGVDLSKEWDRDKWYEGGYVCKADNGQFPYKIAVRHVTFDESSVYPLDVQLDQKLSLVEFDSNDPEYGYVVAVKVFPKDLFEDIVKKLNGDSSYYGYAQKDLDEKSNSLGDVRHIFIDNYAVYKKETPMYYWFNNFNGLPVYWESVPRFRLIQYETSTDNSLPGILTKGVDQCFIDEDDVNKTVCNNAKPANTLDTLDWQKFADSLKLMNPHYNMLNVVAVASMGYTSEDDFAGYFVDVCRDHGGSGKNLKISLSMAVNLDYWYPKNADGSISWGYTNLANRYVRFDPTNTTLYGDEGYFKSNKDAFDSLYLNTSDTNTLKNHYGINGWEYSYDKSANLSAFEAERFPMRKHGMNPLVFSDEINTEDDSLFASSFSVTYFNAGNSVKFRTLLKKFGVLNNYVDSDSPTSGAENWIVPTTVPINPLKVSFTIAPVMTPSQSMVPQDSKDYGLYVNFPFTGNLDAISLNETPYSSDADYVFYADLRSRIHYGVGDWNDLYWDSVYVINSVIRNPVTEVPVPAQEYLKPIIVSIPNKNMLNTVYRYKVKPTDFNNGRWEIPYDSIHRIPLDTFSVGASNGMVNAEYKLYETDSEGNHLIMKNWVIEPVEEGDSVIGWNIYSYGDSLEYTLDYVYSKDSLSVGAYDNLHKIPLQNVLEQTNMASLTQSQWARNLSISVDSIMERDTSEVDTKLRKHPYLTASYNSTAQEFEVAWNGVAPQKRLDEIGTFRGRIPGDEAKWTLSYVSNDSIYFVKSGLQDSVPGGAPYPILERFNMNFLQGNASFFLTYSSGENSITYYRKLDVHVGTRVNSDDSIVVLSQYANVGAEFVPGAWGVDPVDVTVRTVAANEYVTNTFKGLGVVGPVVEVLPSHDFGADRSKWPVVKVTLTKADVDSSRHDVHELKIYKPDLDSGRIIPLENQTAECFKNDLTGVDSPVSCDSVYDYVVLKAMTPTFSSFIVLDTVSAKVAVPVDTLPEIDSLICAEMDADTVWMGTYNGKLDFENPCKGRSNYLLQIRVSSAVAAEHQGTSAERIAWEARRDDIWLKSDIYTSRVDFFGVDGSTEQLRGPFVRVDSVAPTISGVETSVSEEGSDRILNVSAFLADSGSGIASVTMNVYFGNDLVEMKELTFGESVMDTSIAAYFKINGKHLRECVGCKASVSMVVNDHGYNHVEETLNSEKLYPYPQSLVFWYPLSEGYGDVAHEMLGTGLDLSLNSIKTPWAYGGKLTVLTNDEYAYTNKSLSIEKETPVCVEFDGIIGTRDGLVFSLLNGTVADRLFIGVEGNTLYIGNGSVKTSFNNPVWMYSPGHFVFVFEDKVVSLYVNGSFAERITLPVNVSLKGNISPRLGALGSQTGAYFRMSDLRIYDAALTAEQVRDLYHYEYVPDEETEKVIVVRAADVKDHNGLVIDQSCALPGKAYLRQKNSASEGWVNWMVDAEADSYALYLLMRGYTTETSLVEVSVNNVNYGIHRLRSSGLWESVRVGDSLKFNLTDGTNFVSVRPVGGVGLAGLAVVSSPRDFDAVKLGFGQANWKDPEPRVEVRLTYDDYRNKTWARPHVKLRNLTANSFPNAHIRYFYKGEGSYVQATGFWPQLPMSVVPDAGDVFYADLAFNEPIAPYGGAYGDEGVKMGLFRLPDNIPWNIFDDPSYAAGAENGYVVANGVALLDEDGVLLNEWQCYDDGQPAEQAKPSVRALAKDDADNPSQSSRVRVVVENNGSVAVDGFEVRYYYRDANGRMAKPDYYDFAFADTSFVNMGGGLYYVSFMYKNSVLNPGERNAYGNGAQFALHGRDWNPVYFDANDDPSHHGLSRDFAPADSIVVLDKNGNLLWGNAPQPKFADNFVVKPNGKSRVTRVGDVVYVEIDETGYYTLETVNAEGISMARLFEGTWKPGEYMVQIPADKLSADSFLVLRKGNVILNWQLLK